MLSLLIKKKNGILAAAVFILVATSFFSCQKELSDETGGGSVITTLPPDLTTKVSASVSGFVTNENNVAIMGATVQAGTATAITDKYGYFEIKNVQVVQNAAVVTVSKPGYFKGIKTWYAVTGKSAFFRVKLIPKTTTGNVNAAVGGAVTLSNGLIISLAANSMINNATGAAYNGTVNVSAHWIDPTATDLNEIMPGDLRGLDDAGLLKTLTSYGMAAVELTGTAGELLQVAPGKKATLTFPIPAAILATAPASIPLWYFDESLGLWKQEGSATKTGNRYVGDVGHFSFWNCDYPSSYVHFDCTVVDAAGHPLQNAVVTISVTGSQFNSRNGFTDSSGYVGGLIPDNQQLLMEIFSDHTCNTPSYSQTLTTSSANISLGNIMVPNATIANITGNILDCNNSPVSNGYILINKGGLNYHYAADNTGNFNFSIALCSNNTVVNLIAEDVTALQQSATISQTLTAGSNALGTIHACGITTQQFINYSIDGTNYSLTAPADSFTHYWGGPVTLPAINADAVMGFYPTPNAQSYVRIQFMHANIALNSSQLLVSFLASQLTYDSIPAPLYVNITEYGAIGQFISGNFSGIFISRVGNIPHAVTCNFRVRRGS